MTVPVQRRDGAGYRFGRYTLIRPLGVGGMAQVWLARKEMYGGVQKIVALKLPADLLGLDKANVEALLNEIAITSQFSHSHIVHVFDAGVHRGVVFIELERVDGIDLDQLLNVMRMRNSPMSLGVAVYIWRSVLEALHYAFTYVREGKPHPVIHRDLNPSNVLISSSGEVKVMDFGIAKMLSQETSGLHIKGKIRYMPKEQARGYSSTQVDLYGSAAMFWEMIEGKRFRGEVSPVQMVDHVLSGAPEPMTSSRVEEELRQLYELCTHPEQKRRPANPAEVLERLKLWPGRVADASDLRELYTWQLEAKRHSGFTQGDFEVPHDMIRLVEILRAIDAQEVEPPRDVEPAAKLPAEATPDAPSYFRRPYRSSDFRAPDVRPPNVAHTEDAPIPGREPQRVAPEGAGATRIEPGGDVPRRSSLGPTERLPTEPASTDNPGRAERKDEREPTWNRELPGSGTVVIERGTRLRVLLLGGVAAVFAVALGSVVVALLWAPTQPSVSTAKPRPAAIEPENVREPELESAGPELTPIPTASIAAPAPEPAVAPAPAPAVAPEMAAAGDDTEPAIVPASAKIEPPSVPTPAPSEPPATTVQPTPSPKPKATKPKPQPAMVEVRLAPHFAEGELRIGKKTFGITKTIDVKLTAGTHSIAWRPDTSSAWRKAGKLHLSSGNLYTVRLGASGVLVSSSPKVTP